MTDDKYFQTRKEADALVGRQYRVTWPFGQEPRILDGTVGAVVATHHLKDGYGVQILWNSTDITAPVECSILSKDDLDRFCKPFPPSPEPAQDPSPDALKQKAEIKLARTTDAYARAHNLQFRAASAALHAFTGKTPMIMMGGSFNVDHIGGSFHDDRNWLLEFVVTFGMAKIDNIRGPTHPPQQYTLIGQIGDEYWYKEPVYPDWDDYDEEDVRYESRHYMSPGGCMRLYVRQPVTPEEQARAAEGSL